MSTDNDQRALPLFVTLQAPPIRQNLTIDEARHKQDAALRILRLHRYKIPEDGNCMFRAVASQLRLDQDRVHPILREAASDWADLHVEDLLASLLVDGVDEVLMSVSLSATLSLSLSLSLYLSLPPTLSPSHFPSPPVPWSYSRSLIFSMCLTTSMWYAVEYLILNPVCSLAYSPCCFTSVIVCVFERMVYLYTSLMAKVSSLYGMDNIPSLHSFKQLISLWGRFLGAPLR